MRKSQDRRPPYRRVFAFEAMKDLLTSVLKDIVPGSNLTIKLVGDAIAAGSAQRISDWLVPGTNAYQIDELEGLANVEEAMIAQVLDKILTERGFPDNFRDPILARGLARYFQAVPAAINHSRSEDANAPRTVEAWAEVLPDRMPIMRAGARISGHFVLRVLIAQGDTGEVWIAENGTDNSECIVKIYRDRNYASFARWELKAHKRATASGGDAGIVPVIDAFPEHDFPTVIRDYFPGVDLSVSLRSGDLDLNLSESYDLIRQIAEVLAFAHDHGIVSTNLKASKILRDEDGRIAITGLIAPGDDDATLNGNEQVVNPESWARLRAAQAVDLEALANLAIQILLRTNRRERPRDWSETLAERGVPHELIALFRKTHSWRSGATVQNAGDFVKGWDDAMLRVSARRPDLRRRELNRLDRFNDVMSSGSKGPRMVVMPRVPFFMGASSSDENASHAEMPSRQIAIEHKFCMSAYTITFSQYDKFCIATGHTLPRDWDFGRGSYPVIGVSWIDANAYCDWLSEQTGERYRLPTEVEWEYACRAGTNTLYSFGSRISPSQARFAERQGRFGATAETGPVPVTQLDARNNWHLNHMHGNVSEWCSDAWHSNYHNAPNNASSWEEAGNPNRRVTRGGGWASRPESLRSSSRTSLLLNHRGKTVGFRVARDNYPLMSIGRPA